MYSIKVEQPFFTILFNFYNSPNIESSLKSVLNQDYAHFDLLVLDDASTNQECSKKAGALCKASPKKANYLRNSKRLFASGSRYLGIQEADADSILVFVDGDDWLIRDSVLSTLSTLYQQTNALCTFGAFIDFGSGKKNSWCPEIPGQIIKEGTLRQTIEPSLGAVFVPPHLRTCRASVAKKVSKKDLQDERGFFEVSSDVALFYPILEMARDRSVFIEEPLYVYNSLNPLNDRLIKKEMQIQTDVYLKSLRSYDALEDTAFNTSIKRKQTLSQENFFK